jgi:hypothetical protein
LCMDHVLWQLLHLPLPATFLLNPPVLSAIQKQGDTCSTWRSFFIMVSRALCLMFAWGSPAFMAAFALYCLAHRWPVLHGPTVVVAAAPSPACNY